MADDGVPDTADAQAETAPRPENKKLGAPAEQDAKHDVAPDAQETAAAEGLPEGLLDAIRSVFVARATASSEASAADFSHMQNSDDGIALRGAYVAHLADVGAASAGGGDLSGGNVLREAYLAHAAAGAEARGSRRPKRSAAVRRTATAPSRRPKSSKSAARSLVKRKAKSSAKRKAKSAVKRPAKSAAKRPAGRLAKAAAGTPVRGRPKAKTKAAAGKRPAAHMGRGKAKAKGARRGKRRG